LRVAVGSISPIRLAHKVPSQSLVCAAAVSQVICRLCGVSNSFDEAGFAEILAASDFSNGL
jgi:hypothetical protein